MGLFRKKFADGDWFSATVLLRWGSGNCWISGYFRDLLSGRLRALCAAADHWQLKDELMWVRLSGLISAGGQCVVAVVLLMATEVMQQCRAEDPLVLVSSFASGADGGITAFRLQTSTATLQPVNRTSGIPQPFFFDVSPDRRQLFSIHAETFGGSATEELAAWKLDAATGQLTPVNRRTTRGTASCFVEVDRTGRTVLCANYASGSVVAWRIQSDGSLSEPSAFVQHAGSSVNPARQKEPHAHCFVISPDNRFAYTLNKAWATR